MKKLIILDIIPSMNDQSVAKTVKNFAKVSKYVLFGLIILWLILNLIQQNISLAQSESGPVNNELTNLVSTIFDNVGVLIGALAVVMIIIAGIVYLFDFGGGKQIGIAKEMVTYAISGVILFILGAWLLSEVSTLFTPPDINLGRNGGSEYLNNYDNDGSAGDPYLPPGIPGS